MSNDTQTIWFFIAFILFIVAAFIPLRDPGHRTVWDIHPGWLGLAAFTVVFFWNAVKAS